MRDPRSAASRSAPTALTAAVVIFVALAFPAPLITWWSALGLKVPAISAVLTAYYMAQVIILAAFLSSWCLPRVPLIVKVAIVAAGGSVTVAALTVPSLITYGLFYTASTVICLVLAVQQLGRAPLWPPRPQDLPLAFVPVPLIFASLFVVAAITTWVLGIQLTNELTTHASATGLLGTVAHIDTGAELLIRSVWTGVGQEAGAALLITGLMRRNVAWPVVYVVPAVVRVATLAVLAGRRRARHSRCGNGLAVAVVRAAAPADRRTHDLGCAGTGLPGIPDGGDQCGPAGRERGVRLVGRAEIAQTRHGRSRRGAVLAGNGGIVICLPGSRRIVRAALTLLCVWCVFGPASSRPTGAYGPDQADTRSGVNRYHVPVRYRLDVNAARPRTTPDAG